MAENYSAHADKRQLVEAFVADNSPSTDAMQAEIQTLESVLQKPRPETSYSNDDKCQRIVRLVEQIGATPQATNENTSADEEPPYERIGHYELLEKLGEGGMLPPIRKGDRVEDTPTKSLASDRGASVQTLGEEQSASPPRHRETVQSFGDYELVEELARGGMGVVYKARQVSLSRTVALKMILAGQLASKQDVQRFYSEAEAVAKLDHPNIVPIYEIGQHQGQHYFSMGFVEGHSLEAIVRDNPLPSRKAAEYMRTVAEAIHYAHDAGVLHRDIKPSNVLVNQQDQPKVTDFGLAKRTAGDSNLTATGQVLGTPSYMPPEQALGEHREIDRRSDVYSLGATLYYLVVGRPPFQGESATSTLMQVIEKTVVPPRVLNPDIDKDLETIILKCLEKDRLDRYETAQYLAEELDRYLKGEPIKARPVGSLVRTWRWCNRNRGLAAAWGSVAALLTAVLVLIITSEYSARNRLQAKNEVIQKLDKIITEIDGEPTEENKQDDESIPSSDRETQNDRLREKLAHLEKERQQLIREMKSLRDDVRHSPPSGLPIGQFDAPQRDSLPLLRATDEEVAKLESLEVRLSVLIHAGVASDVGELRTLQRKVIGLMDQNAQIGAGIKSYQDAGKLRAFQREVIRLMDQNAQIGAGIKSYQQGIADIIHAGVASDVDKLRALQRKMIRLIAQNAQIGAGIRSHQQRIADIIAYGTTASQITAKKSIDALVQQREVLERKARAFKPDVRPREVDEKALDAWKGEWINTDIHTNATTRLVISKRGDKVIIRGFGKCHPDDCDWGATSLRHFVAKAPGSRIVGRTTWRHGFADYHMVLRIEGDELIAESFTIYNDNSGRSSRSRAETFVRNNAE